MASMYPYTRNDTKTIIRALFCWHQAILLQLLLIEAVVIAPRNDVPSNLSKSWTVPINIRHLKQPKHV